jgi:hypothetical protein
MDQKKDNALLGHKGVFKECLKQILFVEQFAEEMKLNEEAEYVSIVNAARKALRECRTTLKKAERLEGWRRDEVINKIPSQLLQLKNTVLALGQWFRVHKRRVAQLVAKNAKMIDKSDTDTIWNKSFGNTEGNAGGHQTAPASKTLGSKTDHMHSPRSAHSKVSPVKRTPQKRMPNKPSSVSPNKSIVHKARRVQSVSTAAERTRCPVCTLLLPCQHYLNAKKIPLKLRYRRPLQTESHGMFAPKFRLCMLLCANQVKGPDMLQFVSLHKDKFADAMVLTFLEPTLADLLVAKLPQSVPIDFKQAMHAARNSKLDLVYILRSTSSSQLTTMVSSMNSYHKEEELNELVRLCERHNTPCAVNEATASAVLQQICNPY